MPDIAGTVITAGENFTGKGFRGKGTTSKESLQTGGVGRGVSGGKGGIAGGTGQLNARGGRLNPAYAKWQDYTTPKAAGPPIDHKTLQNGVNMMADAAMRYQDRKDQMSATDAFLAAQAQVRELRLGVGKNGEQTGYLATSGKDAMNGYQSHVAGFNSIYQAGADGLSGNARQKYLAMSVPQVNKLQDEAARQRFNGEKQYEQEQAILGLEGAKQEGAIRPDQMFVPDESGITPFQAATMSFDTPQKRQAASTDLANSLMKSYYRSMQDSDPSTAYQTTRGYFEGIKDQLPTDAKNSIDSWLDAREKEWKAQVKLAENTRVDRTRNHYTDRGTTDMKALFVQGFTEQVGGMFTNMVLVDPTDKESGRKQAVEITGNALMSMSQGPGGIISANEAWNELVSSDEKYIDEVSQIELGAFMADLNDKDYKRITRQDNVQVDKVAGTLEGIRLGTEDPEAVRQQIASMGLRDDNKNTALMMVSTAVSFRTNHLTSDQKDAQRSLRNKYDGMVVNGTFNDKERLQAHSDAEVGLLDWRDYSAIVTKNDAGPTPKFAKGDDRYKETEKIVKGFFNVPNRPKDLDEEQLAEWATESATRNSGLSLAMADLNQKYAAAKDAGKDFSTSDWWSNYVVETINGGSDTSPNWFVENIQKFWGGGGNIGVAFRATEPAREAIGTALGFYKPIAEDYADRVYYRQETE